MFVATSVAPENPVVVLQLLACGVPSVAIWQEKIVLLPFVTYEYVLIFLSLSPSDFF